MTIGRSFARLSRLARLASLALIAGCSATASSSPYWTRIQPGAIDQPPGFMTVHVDSYGSPIPGCTPCHPAVDTTMTGVTTGPSGLVAVGWIFQDFHGVAWHSADGSRWTLDDPLSANTVLQAVAADDHRYVAVGLNGQGSTAWSSTDGATWQQTSSPSAFAASPLRMTAVIHWSGGFVASGFEGNEFATANAAFWVSPDGLTWQRAPDAPDLHDARIWAMADGGPGLVAVGTPGSADAPGPAAVWTSSDGLRWTRLPDSPVFAGARMRTIASVPGIGLVAAGEDLAGDTGAVWTSPDGTAWTRAPTVPDLGRPGIQVRMYAAIAGGPGAVVVGTATEGMQYGEGVAWTSPDGLAWTRQKSSAEFSDGELTGVTRLDSTVVAVGDRGAPDLYVATVWTSPPNWTR
jgi:hypothetical protein